MAESPDVIDLLLSDHRLLGELLVRLDGEDRPAEMRQLFLRIAGELAVHESAEDEIVFPAARVAVPRGGHEVLELMAEHDEVNSLMAEMLRLNPAGFGFVKRASALVAELQAHFAEEEAVLFPRLREVLGPDELAELAIQVQALRCSVQSTQLIPLTDR